MNTLKLRYRVPPTVEQISNLGITTKYATVLKVIERIFRDLSNLGMISNANRIDGMVDTKVHQHLYQILGSEYWVNTYYGNLSVVSKPNKVRVADTSTQLLTILNKTPGLEICLYSEQMSGKGVYSHEKHSNPLLDSSFNGKPIQSIICLSDNVIIDWVDELTMGSDNSINTSV
jgi:hypothetical protein